MSLRYKTYTADTLHQALLKMYIDLGKDAMLISQKQIRKGGIWGLFGKKQVQILAAAPLQKEDEALPYSFKERMQRVPFMNYPQNCHNFYKKIVSAGIEEEFAKQLMDEVVSNNSMRALQEKDFLLTKFQEALLHHLQIAGPIKLDGQGNVIVLVGPTGVGKTTTLVKLAAEFAFKKEKKVAFITIDTYRVAAVEQLKVYASILNAPLKVVFSPDEFQKALDEFSICDVVFVDTGGRSQRNIIQIAELSRFLQPCIQRLDIHLLLSATTKYKDLLSTIESFKEVGAKKVIITKVDETESGGALLSALAKAKMGISYITMGQNVPEDIEVATPQRVVQMLFGAQ